jgi:type I restriction enzyme M protein
MIHHLSANGLLGMVLANGSLSSQSGGEGRIRQAIIEDELVEGIVAMPPQLFYTTQIPVSLWFLNRAKKPDRPHPVHRRPQPGHDGQPPFKGNDR